MLVFVQNSKIKIFPFCVMTFEPIITKAYQAPQNGFYNLCFVKDKYIWGEKMARKGPTEVIYKFSFISNRSLSENDFVWRTEIMPWQSIV